MKATTGRKLDITTYKDTIPSVAILATIVVTVACSVFAVDEEPTPAVASAAVVAQAD